MTISVLVVDDSAFVRHALTRELSRFDDIVVTGSAADAFEARRLIVAQPPDVVTLDVEMPLMDGITFLGKVMTHHPLPVVVVSSSTPVGSARAIEALRAGAFAAVCKPGRGHALATMATELAETIRAAAAVDPARLLRMRRAGLPRVMAVGKAIPKRTVVIGTSLGGPAALESILTVMPADGPGIVAALHMPAGYTASFANRLDALTHMHVTEARHGDKIKPGLCLVAPGGVHTIVRGSPKSPHVVLRADPGLGGHVPSIDVLFESTARTLGSSAVGAILTGMGSDGAAGLRAMRDAGAATVAQDEATSIVFGMPGQAVKAGAVCHMAALGDIPRLLIRLAAARASRA